MNDILLALLGGGNIILFIKFLIERHDRKTERKEDKSYDKFVERLEKLEKDVLRTQLLFMISLKPEEKTEILTVGQHYFVDLKGNWYMTGVFSKWCEKYDLEPEWFKGNI